jgi:uncharacterized coiled-coil protein SlyX
MDAKAAIQQRFQELKNDLTKFETASRASGSRLAAFQDALTIISKGDVSEFTLKKLEDKVRKEKQNIDDLELKMAHFTEQLSAFEETLKLLEKKPDENGGPELRPGSELFKVREAIKTKGEPMTLSEMVAVAGKPDNTKSRNSMRGSIARYARTGTIFVKTAASTFGLVELGHKQGADYI